MLRSRFGLLISFLVLAMMPSLAFGQRLLSGSGPWSISGKISPRGWDRYMVDVSDHHGLLKIRLPERRGKVTLFFRKGANPDLQNFDIFENFPSALVTAELSIDNTTSVRLSSGRWYVGMYSTSGCQIEGTIERKSVVSHKAGMGALVDENGTGFRLFAPFGSSVSVAGDFNAWNQNDTPLVSEGNGYWSVYRRSAVANQQYRYVIRNGANTFWRQDPYSLRLTNSNGNSVIYNQSAFQWTDGGYSTPPWNKLVIYEMHIGTFHDAPSGVPGSFYTAINRLNYLQDLGITAIKLMPVFEFAGDFSWGYNPSNPFAVETAYGGPDALKAFVNAAHQRGIAVLLDVVHNHYGPSDMDLWQFDGWSQNGWGGIYFYNDERAVTPWGNTRPDFGRSAVRDYIRDNTLMWTHDFRVDGFRWDSVLNIRTTPWGDNADGWSLMQWINDSIDAQQPWKINIGEDLQNNEWITKSTGAGGAGFDSQWTPSFVHPMRPVMTNAFDSDRNMFDVANAITQNYNGAWLQRVIYTESHDEVANGRARVPQEIDPGNPGSYWARKRSTLGAAIVMTAPGIPMIFQGQEILEDEWFRDDDPIDWSKETTYAGIRQMYQDLIGLRRNLGGLTAGLAGPHVNVFHVNNSDKVIAFHRWDQGGAGDDVVVIANFSNQSWSNYLIGMPRGGQWNVLFNSDWNGYSADFGNTFTADANAVNVPRDGLNFSAGFDLGPYSVVILSQPGGSAPMRIAPALKGLPGMGKPKKN